MSNRRAIITFIICMGITLIGIGLIIGLVNSGVLGNRNKGYAFFESGRMDGFNSRVTIDTTDDSDMVDGKKDNKEGMKKGKSQDEYVKNENKGAGSRYSTEKKGATGNTYNVKTDSGYERYYTGGKGQHVTVRDTSGIVSDDIMWKTKTKVNKGTINTEMNENEKSSGSQKEQNSTGEYISPDEYEYRVSLIRDLTIKTVVINSLTRGNGISQEFYRVVFINQMIPVKILDEIVTSREFRDLIPEKYLERERALKELHAGNPVVFKNDDLRNVLLLWSRGELTPIQNAWKSGAIE